MRLFDERDPDEEDELADFAHQNLDRLFGYLDDEIFRRTGKRALDFHEVSR